MTAPSRQIIAVGAGHAHLHLARHAPQLAQRGIALTLIDVDQFWFAGAAGRVILPGVRSKMGLTSTG